MRLPKQLSETAIVLKIERAARHGMANFKRKGVELGIGDDAALWKPRRGFETILTTDWFLEGSHFWRDWHTPETIGWKSVMRATSDIAAMGGEPRCFLLSLAIPNELASGWLDRFLTGMTRASKKSGCPLAGGDTTRNDRVLINITVVGEVPPGTALLRSGAKPGDLIFVSGRLGEAELGLRLAKNARRRGKSGSAKLLEKHLFPEARVELGEWLRKTANASAAMDLSDGLSLDLRRLCAASGVGAEIYAEQLPTASPKFAKAFSPSKRLAAALHGGDDYELLFCVHRKHSSRIPTSKFGLPLAHIGEIVASSKITLVAGDGKKSELLSGGWDPFH